MNVNNIWWIILIVVVLLGAYFIFANRQAVETPSAGFLEKPEVTKATSRPSIIDGSEVPDADSSGDFQEEVQLPANKPLRAESAKYPHRGIRTCASRRTLFLALLEIGLFSRRLHLSPERREYSAAQK